MLLVDGGVACGPMAASNETLTLATIRCVVKATTNKNNTRGVAFL